MQGPIVMDRLSKYKKDEIAIKKLEDTFKTSYDNLPRVLVEIDREQSVIMFESLRKKLNAAMNAKGEEEKRLYSEYLKDYKLAAQMVQSYADAAKAYKEGIEKIAASAGSMIGIKEEMKISDKIISATLLTLSFWGTVSLTAKAGGKAYTAYLEKKAAEQAVKKESQFLMKLSIENKMVDLIKELPNFKMYKAKAGSFYSAIEDLKEFFSNKEMVKLLNLEPGKRIEYIIKTMTSTIDPNKLTKSQKIIYDEIKKINFGQKGALFNSFEKGMEKITKNLEELSKTENKQKVYKEVWDFLSDFNKTRSEMINESAIKGAAEINKITKQEIQNILTNEANIQYRKMRLIKMASGRKELPLGDHFAHLLLNDSVFLRAFPELLNAKVANALKTEKVSLGVPSYIK